MRLLRVILAGVAAALLWQSAVAGGSRVGAVEVELVADRAAVHPGQSLRVGLRIRHDPGWHTYWRNPGDAGLPTEIDWKVPEGIAVSAIQWPTPSRLPVGPLMNFGYDDEIVLPATMTVPATMAAAKVDLSARAQWLMCREVCVPGEASLSLQLPVSDQPAVRSQYGGLFDAMAAHSPHGVRNASVALADGRLSMLVEIARGDSDAVPHVAFFPYAPGLIDNAAAQTLYRVGDAQSRQYRIEVPLAERVARADFDKAGFFTPAAGVVVVDGQAQELGASLVASLPAGIAVAGPAPERAAAGGPGAGSAAPSATSSSEGSALAGRAAAIVRGAFDAAPTPAAGAARPAAPAWSQATAPTAAPTAASASPAIDLAPADGDLTSLWAAIALALVGGLLLNLMPCVFPVIGLKVLSFANDAAGSDTRQRRVAGRGNALAFTMGVLLSFWVLAGLAALLQGAGRAIGWGFQLQSPGFVVAMALLFVAIGLNLSGVYGIGNTLTRLGGVGAQRQGSGYALLSGVLAVLVATPCTAPFMGSALGFTLGRPFAQVVAVFTALGIGMSSPYLILGFFPGWMRWLPRPGRWMESLRQLLAFPMYATAVWLAWVVAQQVGINGGFGVALGAIALGLGAWIYGRFVESGRSLRGTGVGSVAALACVLLAIWLAWPGAAEGPAPGTQSSLHSGSVAGDASGAIRWQRWDEATLAQARAAGRPVFVEFTAAWCVSCQVNKRVVLDRPAVVNAMQRLNVVPLRADWTRMDASIRAELARHGRTGVPLYLLYLPGREQPAQLPEVLTTQQVLDALAGAA